MGKVFVIAIDWFSESGGGLSDQVLLEKLGVLRRGETRPVGQNCRSQAAEFRSRFFPNDHWQGYLTVT